MATYKQPVAVPHEKWSCSSCGTSAYAVWYKSGLMKQCYTCQGYSNMQINSRQKKNKKSKIAREVTFSLKQWHKWIEKHPRVCTYCKITDAEYYALGYKSANNKILEALGIDRRTDGNYDLSEIDWCCYPCNRTKANSFSHAEMREFLSPGLESIWRSRLSRGIVGVDYTALIEYTNTKPKIKSKLKPGVKAKRKTKRKARRR